MMCAATAAFPDSIFSIYRPKTKGVGWEHHLATRHAHHDQQCMPHDLDMICSSKLDSTMRKTQTNPELAPSHAHD
jgi:hypothetical protein